MRMRTLFATAAVMALSLAGGAGIRADVTRTLQAELSVDGGGRVGVENLAGTMRIVPGGGGRIVAVATVHAESGRLADSMRLEEARGEKGERILRVVYPVDEYTSFRYGGGGESGGGWLGFLGGGSHTSTRYAGRKVKVSSSRGVELWADVEIQVPSGSYRSYFRNVVGDITAGDVDGDFTFDSGSGRITLDRINGDTSADTGSGTIEARNLSGRFSGDTGSGDILLTGFDGESISCDTGSGDVEIRDAVADTVSSDTGSGSIRMTQIRADHVAADTGSGKISFDGGSARKVVADTGSGSITILADGVEEFSADTGSGDVTLETDGYALRRVNVDTGSGDAEIRMGAGVTFHAIADQGSGTIRNGFDDARAIIRDKEVIGYRRGDEKVRITFETGSGTLILMPTR